MPLYDLTISVTTTSIVFPGDPVFSSKTLSDVAQGQTFTLREFAFGNHTGTHVDFPSHVINGGKCSSDYPLESLMGKGRIVDIADDSNITAAHVVAANIQAGDIVFFKTRNTREQLLFQDSYTENFAAIEPEAAKLLVKRGISIVGIDYLSVDRIEDETLPSHNILLGNEIPIVENLDLRNIPAGEYNIGIFPLKIDNVDGVPARVIACSAAFFSNKGPQDHEETKSQDSTTNDRSNRL